VNARLSPRKSKLTNDSRFTREGEIRTEIVRESKTRYGGDRFEVLCIEGSWGDTLDDRQTLQLLKALNRTGSIFREVICRIPSATAELTAHRKVPEFQGRLPPIRRAL
jgi:hypothetical protein